MFLIFLAGCAGTREKVTADSSRSRNYALTMTQPDTRVPWDLRDDRPFHLEFGRGSGWDGLSTVTVDESGHVTLYRGGNLDWQRGTLRLSAPAVQELRDCIRRGGLMRMEAAYAAGGVHDGSQWVLWITQSGRSKRTYCNNHFPAAIQRFAINVDRMLTENGGDSVAWTEVPVSQARKHEKSLWKAP